MQIVININDSAYEAIKNEYCVSPPQKGLLKVLWDAVKNGTPLPKGHGRLVDESQIKKCGMNFVNHHIKTDAPTIIEADRSEE